MATRADYRLATMKLLGDVEELEATVASSSESDFTDELNLYKETGTLVGRMLYVTAEGANFGQTRRVLANDKSTSTLTLSRALPAIPAQGATAQMFNFRDQGVTLSMVHTSINHSIMMVNDDYTVPTYEDIEDTFSYLSPVIEIPTEIKAFAELAFQNPDTLEWIDIPIMQRYVDQWARTVVVMGDALVYMDGMAVRIKGYGRPPILTDDTTDCPVDIEWLMYQTASNISFELARKRMDPTVNERWAQWYGDKADERRSKVTYPYYGHAIPLYG
jgi:hypothetical protein